VGAEKAAAFVCQVGYKRKFRSKSRYNKRRTVEGYKGFMNSESVAVGNMPTAFLALTAELAAAGLSPEELELLLEPECPWCLVARTVATTSPMVATIPSGTPNLIILLLGLFGFAGVM
jgi:hypothetical protein